MAVNWGNVTSGAGGLTPQQQAQQAMARAAAIAAAINAVSRATQQMDGVTGEIVVSAARAAGQQGWRSVTGSAQGYAENEASILQQTAYGVQELLGIVTLGAVPASPLTQQAWDSAPTAAEALQIAAANVAPVGIGALLGGSGVILIGGAVLLAIVLLKR